RLGRAQLDTWPLQQRAANPGSAEWYSARAALMMRLDSPKLADFQSAKQQSSTLRYGAGVKLRPDGGVQIGCSREVFRVPSSLQDEIISVRCPSHFVAG